MAQTCDFPHPLVMKWSVLPARIAAKAWLDPVFLQTLLSDPDSVIRAMAPNSCKALPLNVKFHVHENTARLRHFPLPVLRSELPELADISPEALLKLVEEETGDESLEWCLPASVICRSFGDADYRARLLADATAVLAADGFELEGVQINVHENTPTAHHLALYVNFWEDEVLDYDALVEKTYKRMLS